MDVGRARSHSARNPSYPTTGGWHISSTHWPSDPAPSGVRRPSGALSVSLRPMIRGPDRKWEVHHMDPSRGPIGDDRDWTDRYQSSRIDDDRRFEHCPNGNDADRSHAVSIWPDGQRRDALKTQKHHSQ